MNVEQLCEYLNEIGIVDINNLKNYLTIISTFINNNSNNYSENDLYLISLFAYLRGINKSDKRLYILCANIINSYNRYALLKKYNFLYNFKNILYYKILQRFKSFMISLYKKYPFKNYHSNRYHNNKNNIGNKKNKSYNNTCSNNFYKKNNSTQNLTESNNINIKDKNYKNKDNILLLNNDNNNNIDINSLNINNILNDKRIYRELPPLKKSPPINIDMCINQSNINFEKYFINKKVVVCKKCRPSYIESIKKNKKELYIESNRPLRKNKSETKFRIKKMDYEEKTRSNNLAKIKPTLKKKIKAREKLRRDEELSNKEKEDKLFNKLKDKYDKNDKFDRLYREKIIEKKEKERKEKEEEINKIKKSPIIWDKLYLETNDRIIYQNKNKHKRNKTCSYFMPNRGRVYKYEEKDKANNNINNEVIKKNKDNKDNKDKNAINKEIINKNTDINNLNGQKIVKKEDEDNDNNLNDEENISDKKNKNDNNKDNSLKENLDNDLYPLVDSEIKLENSVDKKEDNEDKDKEEEKKEEEKVEDEEKEEKVEKLEKEEEIRKKWDNFNISSGGIKSKEIQELLKNKFNKNTEYEKFKDSESNSNESDNGNTKDKENKSKFADLLCSNNTENNEE